MSDEEPSAELQAAAERFYATAGRCIVGWSFIDRVIYDVFEAALDTDPVKASIIYYRSPSISDHLVLTDKIVSATLAKKSNELKAWNALKKRADALLPTRNKIAHHPVTVFWTQSGQGDEEWLAYIEELRKHPHLDARDRFERNLANQIDLKALAEHHNATVALREDLMAFLDRFGDALRKPAPEPT